MANTAMHEFGHQIFGNRHLDGDKGAHVRGTIMAESQYKRYTYDSWMIDELKNLYNK